jgi:hypothetical protein
MLWNWRVLFSVYVVLCKEPITASERSKAWTVFAHSHTEIVGSHPTRVKNVCVHVFCMYVGLHVGRGLALDWSPIQWALPIWKLIIKLKSGEGPRMGSKAVNINNYYYHPFNASGRFEGSCRTVYYLLHILPCLDYFSAPKMEVKCSSETSVDIQRSARLLWERKNSTYYKPDYIKRT